VVAVFSDGAGRINQHQTMKITTIILATMCAVVVCQAQPPTPPPPPPSPGSPTTFQQRLVAIQQAANTEPKDTSNYLIRVEWKEPKGDAKHLEILTAEGQVELDTIQKSTVKINDNEIPTTLKCTGNLTTIDGDKGRLKLFLGRTVPYVTSTYAGPNGKMGSSYSQMSAGLDSAFIVQYGKTQVIQSDENGEISVLVTRKEN
jgi:hypothetical protein